MEKTNRQKKSRRIWLGYAANFLLACLPVIGFLLFMLIPMLLSVGMSFFEMRSPLFEDAVFIGFDNFASLLWGQYAHRFYQSFLNTFIFWLNVPISMAIGLGVAYLLNKKIMGRRLFRMIFFIPYVCSLVAVSMTFRMMYDTNYGVFNTLLGKLGIDKVPWITSPKYFMLSATLMQSWKNVGFCVILFTAAMSNVNKSLYEAAYLDGASTGTVFRKITLPAISPITFYLLTVCTIGALQVVGEVQVLSANNTYVLEYSYNTVVLYVYDMAFYFQSQYGFGIGAAASWILVIFILIVTRINFRLSDRWVHYDF